MAVDGSAYGYDGYYGDAVKELYRSLYFNRNNRTDVSLLYDDLSDIEGVNIHTDFDKYCDMSAASFSSEDIFTSLCSRVSAITHRDIEDVSSFAKFAGFGEYLSELGDMLHKPRVPVPSEREIEDKNRLYALETQFVTNGSFASEQNRQAFIDIFTRCVNRDVRHYRSTEAAMRTSFDGFLRAKASPDNVAHVDGTARSSRSLLFDYMNQQSQLFLEKYSLFSRVHADKAVGLPVSDDLIASLGEDYQTFLQSYQSEGASVQTETESSVEVEDDASGFDRADRPLPSFDFSSPVEQDRQYD